jgi:hypothetical protein
MRQPTDLNGLAKTLAVARESKRDLAPFPNLVLTLDSGLLNRCLRPSHLQFQVIAGFENVPSATGSSQLHHCLKPSGSHRNRSVGKSLRVFAVVRDVDRRHLQLPLQGSKLGAQGFPKLIIQT